MAFLNIINEVRDDTSRIISEKGYDNVDFVVEYSRSGFGDITCNVAFLLAKDLKKNPQEGFKILTSIQDLIDDTNIGKYEHGFFKFHIREKNNLQKEKTKFDYKKILTGDFKFE